MGKTQMYINIMNLKETTVILDDDFEKYNEDYSDPSFPPTPHETRASTYPQPQQPNSTKLSPTHNIFGFNQKNLIGPLDGRKSKQNEITIESIEGEQIPFSNRRSCSPQLSRPPSIKRPYLEKLSEREECPSSNHMMEACSLSPEQNLGLNPSLKYKVDFLGDVIHTSKFHDMQDIPPPPAPLRFHFIPTDYDSLYSDRAQIRRKIQINQESTKPTQSVTAREVYSKCSPVAENPVANSKKSKIKCIVQIKNVKLVENTDWIKSINNLQLEWSQADESPLQIRILLNELKSQAVAIQLKEFRGNQPPRDVVSDALPFSLRFQNYAHNSGMLGQVKLMANEFPTYRTIYGDGNCFYRAFNFSFLEMALTHQSSLYFLRYLRAVSDPTSVRFTYDKANHVFSRYLDLNPRIMRAFVIQRLLLLYSYRVQLSKNNDPSWQAKTISLLQQIFNQPPYFFDSFLIIGIKNYIADVLNTLEEFQNLDTESRQVIRQEVLKYGVECSLNQYPILALSFKLCVCVSLYQEINKKCEFQVYGQPEFNKVILYYRTGHYDVIYPYRSVYAHIRNRNPRV